MERHPCHAAGQGPCVSAHCAIKGRRAPAWCPPGHDAPEPQTWPEEMDQA